MSLQARLDRIREGFEKQAPPEVLAIMHGATDNLRASGIVDKMVGEGQRAVDFTLENSRGRPTALADALSEGPVVLTFFRGDW